MAGRVGRPVEASKTLDEALARYYAGSLPKRPRNDIERKVMRKTRGPKVNPNSPTQQAAFDAVYFVQACGVSLREAARTAAQTHGVKPDSVRPLARKLLKGPQSQVAVKVAPHLQQLVGDLTKLTPLVVEIKDVSGAS